MGISHGGAVPAMLTALVLLSMMLGYRFAPDLQAGIHEGKRQWLLLLAELPIAGPGVIFFNTENVPLRVVIVLVTLAYLLFTVFGVHVNLARRYQVAVAIAGCAVAAMSAVLFMGVLMATYFLFVMFLFGPLDRRSDGLVWWSAMFATFLIGLSRSYFRVLADA